MIEPITVLLCFIAAIALVMLSMPISAALLLTTITALIFELGFQVTQHIIITEFEVLFLNSTYLSLPVFFLAAGLLTGAGIIASLFHLSMETFKKRPEVQLPVAVVIMGAIFGSITGSSMATLGMLTKSVLPQLQKAGMPSTLSIGVVAASGGFGMIIPPSIIMIIYAMLAELDPLNLFRAAIVPGIMTVLGYTAVIVWFARFTKLNFRAKKEYVPSLHPASRPRMDGINLTIRPLFLVLVTGWSIYGGFFTIVEASFICLLIAVVVVLNRITLAEAQKVTLESFVSVGSILSLIFAAQLFSFLIAASGVSQEIFEWIVSLEVSFSIILAAVLLLYFLFGMVGETFTIILVTFPVLSPLLEVHDVNLYWWAVLSILMIELSLITPPVGLNLMVVKAAARDTNMFKIIKSVMPFIIMDVLKIALLFLFPSLTLIFI